MRWVLLCCLPFFLTGCVHIFPEQPSGVKTIVIRAEGCSAVEGPEVESQLIVERPTTSSELDKNIIAVMGETDTLLYISDTVLSDDLTEVIERATIEAFLESKKIKGVGGNGSGISADYILLSDIDSFGLYVPHKGATPEARFEMVGQLVDVKTRKVVSKKRFSAMVPVPAKTVSVVANALNDVVSHVLRDVLTWVLSAGHVALK